MCIFFVYLCCLSVFVGVRLFVKCLFVGCLFVGCLFVGCLFVGYLFVRCLFVCLFVGRLFVGRISLLTCLLFAKCLLGVLSDVYLLGDVFIQFCA